MAQSNLVHAHLRDVLNRYSQSRVGQPLRLRSRIPLNEGFLKYCALSHDAAVHAPHDPATRQAYRALNDEVLEQFLLLERVLHFELFAPSGDPYPTFAALRTDVLVHRRLVVRRSEQDGLLEGHPLAMPGLRSRWLINDHFRGVHDAWHIIADAGFDALGEEITATLQASVCSPATLPALIAETRLQNAWVHVQNPSVQEGVVQFPAQKAFAAPAECWSYDAWRDFDQRRAALGAAAPINDTSDQGGF